MGVELKCKYSLLFELNMGGVLSSRFVIFKCHQTIRRHVGHRV